MTPQRTRRLHARAGASAVSLLVALSGCAQPSPETDSPYRERFAQATAQATSDFEREALSDGEISRSEYQEAIDRWVSCMQTAGVEVSLSDQAGYYVYSVAGDMTQYDLSDADCSTGTRALIEPLYVDTLMNPGNEDPNAVLARCFVRIGAAPEGFTATDLQRVMDDGGLSTIDPDDPTFDGYDLNPESNPQVVECLKNPSAR